MVEGLRQPEIIRLFLFELLVYLLSFNPTLKSLKDFIFIVCGSKLFSLLLMMHLFMLASNPSKHPFSTISNSFFFYQSDIRTISSFLLEQFQELPSTKDPQGSKR